MVTQARAQRWVVKAGSNMIVEGGPLLMRDWARQVSLLRRDHQVEVVWVTSGAIASAVERIQFQKAERTLPEKQALSAIGQPLLMDLYNLSLQAVGLVGAQILLSYSDMTDPNRRKNLQNTLEALLAWKVVPILNENDAVATEEIKFGDNDSLSAKVACMLGAHRLVILTDVEGLYDEPPVANPKAKLVPQVARVSDEILAAAEPKAGSARGTGGMYSKLLAAREATEHGIETWLIKGDTLGALGLLAEGMHVGTKIEARQ